MGSIIAVTNQKGGVGKTTTAINLAASLAASERRVLLIDGDPQGNASSGVGLTPEKVSATLYDVLIDGSDPKDAIQHGVHFPSLDVLAATPDLAGAEVELVGEVGRELVLRRAIEAVRGDYDFVLIDCPPSLGLLTVNMLSAADSLIIPLQCEYFALEGLTQLLRTVNLVQQRLNSDLHVFGVLLTMYDARLNLSRQVADDARDYFGNLVFDTVIPRNIRLAEAPSFGRPIVTYDIASVGSSAYLSLAKEVIDRSGTDDSQAGSAVHAPETIEPPTSAQPIQANPPAPEDQPETIPVAQESHGGLTVQEAQERAATYTQPPAVEPEDTSRDDASRDDASRDDTSRDDASIAEQPIERSDPSAPWMAERAAEPLPPSAEPEVGSVTDSALQWPPGQPIDPSADRFRDDPSFAPAATPPSAPIADLPATLDADNEVSPSTPRDTEASNDGERTDVQIDDNSSVRLGDSSATTAP